MTSDSEDDSDYIPTEPQNDGLYSYPFWHIQQLTNGPTADSDLSGSNSDNGRSTKRIRTSPPKLAAEEEEALKKT